MTDEKKLFVPMPNYAFPFFYGSISVLWVFYPADAKVLQRYLRGTGLAPALFNRRGLVSIDFQNYTAFLGNMVSVVNEVEFSIHAYPKSRAAHVPTNISPADYLMGQDATKTIGAFRLWVPADNCVAVDAGRQAFGERKFFTAFQYSVPSPNHPDPAGSPDPPWNYTVYDPPSDPCYDAPAADPPPKPGQGLCKGDPCYPLFVANPSNQPAKDQPSIYSLSADTRLDEPQVGNASPLRLYSSFPGGPCNPPGGAGQKLIASFWNLLGTYAAYTRAEKLRVRLKYGKGKFRMRKDMQAILGDSPAAVGVRVFQSPPQGIQNRAIYVDP